MSASTFFPYTLFTRAKPAPLKNVFSIFAPLSFSPLPFNPPLTCQACGCVSWYLNGSTQVKNHYRHYHKCLLLFEFWWNCVSIKKLFYCDRNDVVKLDASFIIQRPKCHTVTNTSLLCLKNICIWIQHLYYQLNSRFASKEVTIMCQRIFTVAQNVDLLVITSHWGHGSQKEKKKFAI